MAKKIDSSSPIERTLRFLQPPPHGVRPIIQNHGWSTISNLVRKETATLTYKSLNSLAPDYLRKLFAKCSDDREQFLRSSETDLKIPLLKTINGQKAFSYRGAKLWNCLERATKLAPSLNIFKDHL